MSHKGPLRALIDDGLAIGVSGGIGSHTAELYRRLAIGQTLEVTGRQLQASLTLRPTYRMLPRVAARALYHLGLNTWDPICHAARRYGIVHGANFFVPAWKAPGVKYVLMVHDLSAWEAPGLEPVPGWYWPYAKSAMACGVRSADAVVVRTPSTGRRLASRFNVRSERIYVCPDAIKDVYIGPAPPADKREPLLLFVGTLVRRKNPETVVRAFAELATRSPELRLVMVGRAGSASGEVEKAVRESEVTDRIEVRHGLADTDLASLYRHASLLIMPSHYEGFGIPVIEAMASGLPVVASDIEVFREVGGDAAAYYGEPEDVAALASTVAALLDDGPRRVRMAEVGLARSEQFHWDKIIRRYLEIYEAVLSQPRRSA